MLILVYKWVGGALGLIMILNCSYLIVLTNHDNRFVDEDYGKRHIIVTKNSPQKSFVF